MPSALVELNGLRYAWPGQPPCLSIDHLRLEAGEAVFLHGPSGAGKSTLLALIAGVNVAGRGQVRVLDTDLAELGAAARDRFRVDHIGIVFQQFNLLPYLTVLDNVLLPCRFSALRRTRALAEAGSPSAAAERLLTELDLAPGLWHRRADSLSVGQQQRVALARALIGRPELILADEPTSALDAGRQTAFLELLTRECAASGAGLVFVSHDLRLAGRFARVEELTRLNRAGAEAQA
ncbi:MAG: ABC transporter ATP-binding protein [Thiobacillaceae bacterium]|nr:ABC transporter ATP-binding protein [Thiobacillaceae bacterium]